ncbi:hypothetical protein [Pseudoalteromonas sp. MTN2-4]|uniref:hypothetical protein n=1 Tax=Pseudoalteromonas sp. MTN2-4 TaxID=3056555 RepID=UPI0036F434C2
MRTIKIIFAALITLGLAACGSTPQPTVSLKPEVLNAEKKIGIYFAKAEAPTTNIHGAYCLLCYGVASAANATLDKHLKTLPIADLESTKELVLEGYKKSSDNVSYIELSENEVKKLKKFKGELGFAKKDFRPLKESKNIDVLVVVEYWAHGAYRLYDAYIPLTDPQGYVTGVVYSVDLNDNQYIQYQKIDKKVVVDGEWDEPSLNFPGVTNAYYQALEQTKESIKKIFL